MPQSSSASAYRKVHRRISSLLQGETDTIAALSTVVCELYHEFDHFDWVGFYRRVSPEQLKVGPYQGNHGCLTIPITKGVCGRCAREAQTQVVQDVRTLDYHIACSADTRSEIVVPVFDLHGQVRAVLDIDSNQKGAFRQADARGLESLMSLLSPLMG